MDPRLTPSWAAWLREAGYRPGPVLGSGMEGTVVALGDDLVAKIWHRRTAAGLQPLRAFYEAVARAGAPFQAPLILDVLTFDGETATVEPMLRGTPLACSESPEVPEDDVACITAVLAALAAVAPTPALGGLPVLADEPPFETRSVPFARSLGALVVRRARRFREPTRRRLPQVDTIVSAVQQRLEALPVAPVALVHGDLIPANILVTGSVPRAVLDFGFLTTVGDPAFDAAVAASVYDMYGPHAKAHEAILDEAFAARFDYEASRLWVYRAAYALATSNCFSVSGSDGHFEWCMRMLERPEVRESLGL